MHANGPVHTAAAVLIDELIDPKSVWGLAQTHQTRLDRLDTRRPDSRTESWPACCTRAG